MGYHTDFEGRFNLSRPLTEDEAAYLKMFAETRRMKRDPVKILALKGADRNQECLDLLEKLGLSLGEEGDHYCGVNGPSPHGCAGQHHESSIADYNTPSSIQPGLWCQWVPTEDLKGLEWDGGEKFYNYVEWMKYLINHFLTPWGIKVNGAVEWLGEDPDDRGRIVVKDSEVKTQRAAITWEDEE